MAIVRKVLLALLFSLLFGFAVGTWLRLRLEKPVYYLGSVVVPAPGLPLDVCDARSNVLDTCHHEQQIG